MPGRASAKRKTGWNTVRIVLGHATLGLVGDTGRRDYTAIGNVVNFASRLCGRATDDEILLDRRAFLDAEAWIVADAPGPWASRA